MRATVGKPINPVGVGFCTKLPILTPKAQLNFYTPKEVHFLAYAFEIYDNNRKVVRKEGNYHCFLDGDGGQVMFRVKDWVKENFIKIVPDLVYPSSDYV